jgi:hypothetical protein
LYNKSTPKEGGFMNPRISFILFTFQIRYNHSKQMQGKGK